MRTNDRVMRFLHSMTWELPVKTNEECYKCLKQFKDLYQKSKSDNHDYRCNHYRYLRYLSILTEALESRDYKKAVDTLIYLAYEGGQLFRQETKIGLNHIFEKYNI